MSFSDSKAIAGYEENATRRVPGLRDIHRMTALLMAESTPTDGRVLVVGAGGGMELKHFAQTYPNWRMDGVDPSAEMLKLANTALGSLSSCSSAQWICRCGSKRTVRCCLLPLDTSFHR